MENEAEKERGDEREREDEAWDTEKETELIWLFGV